MGTRTYSRRRADGTRVPTALGRATGKFTGGAPVSGRGEAPRRGSPNETLDTFRMADRLIGRVEGAPFYGFGETVPYRAAQQMGYPTRGMIEPPPTREEVNQLTDLSESIRRSIFGIDAGNDEVRRAVRNLGSEESVKEMTGLTGPWIPDNIVGMVRNGTLSANNARRILDAANKAMAEIDREAQTGSLSYRPTAYLPKPAEVRAAKQAVMMIAQEAANRSRLYDADTVNPSATYGQVGNQGGRMGAVLRQQTTEATTRARRMANIINRLLPRMRNPPSRNPDGLPPTGSIGRRILTQVLSDTGTVAFRSAQKLARDYADRVQEIKAGIAEASNTPLAGL